MTRASLALLACALVAACAAPAKKTAEAVPGPGEVRSAGAARALVSLGKSTKAEVRAALGEPVAVDFASGYEVWVYREMAERRANELVLLFAPTGTVSKARIRAGAPPTAGAGRSSG